MPRLVLCAPVANEAGADAEGSKVPRREAIAEQHAAEGKEVSVIEMIGRDMVVQPLRPDARRADVILEKAAALDRCAWHGVCTLCTGDGGQNPKITKFSSFMGPRQDIKHSNPTQTFDGRISDF